MDIWRHSQPDLFNLHGILESSQPPYPVFDASREWDFKFRMLAQEIASEAGILA